MVLYHLDLHTLLYRRVACDMFTMAGQYLVSHIGALVTLLYPNMAARGGPCNPSVRVPQQEHFPNSEGSKKRFSYYQCFFVVHNWPVCVVCNKSHTLAFVITQLSTCICFFFFSCNIHLILISYTASQIPTGKCMKVLHAIKPETIDTSQ